MLCDNSELEAKRDALQEEIAVTVELTQNAVAENARVAQDQDDYNKRYNALVERYDRLKAQYDAPQFLTMKQGMNRWADSSQS